MVSDTTSLHSNKRRSPRLKVGEPVVVTLHCENSSSKKAAHHITCRVSDVSSHGIGVWSDEVLEKDKSYILRIDSPGNKAAQGHPSQVRVKVVWSLENFSNTNMTRGGLRVVGNESTDLVGFFGASLGKTYDLPKEAKAARPLPYTDNLDQAQGPLRNQTQGVNLDMHIMHDLCNVAHIMQLSASRLLRLSREKNPDPMMLEKLALSIKSSAGFLGSNLVQKSKLLPRHNREVPEELSVMELLAELKTITSSMLQIRGIYLSINCINPELTLYGLRSELLRAFLNLLINAADAVDEHDDKWIKIYCDEKNDALLFRISNGGNGIDPKVKDKIFEQGFSTKPLSKGNGLGLSIVREILASHGGTIKVIDHKTSCFELLLPLHR